MTSFLARTLETGNRIYCGNGTASVRNGCRFRECCCSVESPFPNQAAIEAFEDEGERKVAFGERREERGERERHFQI